MMTTVRRRKIKMEMILAAMLGASADWWAASAAHRLKKISGERSANSENPVQEASQ